MKKITLGDLPVIMGKVARRRILDIAREVGGEKSVKKMKKDLSKLEFHVY